MIYEIGEKIELIIEKEMDKGEQVGIPSDLSHLIEGLNFISLIKPGDKVNFYNKTFTLGTSWTEWLMRRYHRESGEKFSLYVSNLLSECQKMLSKYKSGDFQQMIYKNLETAKQGICNSKKTYEDQPGIISKLETCLENIELLLKSQINPS